MPYTAPAYLRPSPQLIAARAGRGELYVNAAVKLMSNRCSQFMSSGLASALTRVSRHTPARAGQIILNIIVVVIMIAVVIITTPLAAGTA